jgi:hypothetical protein
MTKLPLKTIALTAALATAVLSVPVTSAEASHNHGRWVAGVAGFAAGAIVAGALARPRYPAYSGPVYYGRPAPWTPAWYNYCSARYRSFDPVSGTYQPLHGPRRLCR